MLYFYCVCYDIKFLTKQRAKYAKRFAEKEQDIARIEAQLADLDERIGANYYVSGFEHPDVPVIAGEAPQTIELFNWGLIPNWTKNMHDAMSIANRTLNARSETMFEKPSFRDSALRRRCLVIIDGFFEHHWKNKKSYPYHIFLKNDEPMALGGLWDTWDDPVTGSTRQTFSIVTTQANTLMHKIHNNPKGSIGPRMPLIIPKEFTRQWLEVVDDKVDKELVLDLARPFDPELMDAYTVPRLKGKLAVGNTPEATQHYTYDELESSQGSLF
jgi:putative SOS response-associated peptidase YedK